jgi:hypothetical protein
MLGILYDVHANLVALEAVVTDARRKGVTRWLLGGDYAGFGPWPLETLAVLDTLDAEVMLRGNGERWLKEPPPDRPETHEEIARDRDQLGPARVERLYALPARAELEGMLFVHGSPLSDVDSFKRDADDEFDRRLLDGAAARTVIFGHSHLQFRRATWDGDFEFRRTEYDVERAVAAARALESPMRDVIANRYLHASD